MVSTVMTPAEQAFAEFASDFRGNLLRPGVPGYDDARMVRNGLIDRKPALIARCHGTADVVAAVDFAREQGLTISVRGGGHNVAGNAVNDDGIVIDLSDMKAVRVDPERKRAFAQGGATWGDIDRETQLFGLATPGGLVSTTGIGGLTLHGGLGWLRRKYGLALDTLRSVEIVTADGEVRTANAEVNPDLYWAVRGAGSNFGVVTEFEFELNPVGPIVFAAAPFYALEDAAQVLTGWHAFVGTAPDEISSLVVTYVVPDDPHFPEAYRGKPAIILPTVYTGDPAEGERILQPLRELTTPMVDMSGPYPFTVLQSLFDPFFPVGLHYYWKGLFQNDLSAESMEAIIDLMLTRPTPITGVGVWQLGGAMARVPADATAFGNRSAPYLLTLEATWSDSADDERCIAWVRNGWDAMHRFGPGGLYLNFAGFGEEKEALVKAAYGDNYPRLQQIKAKYDPANLFHMNQNVRPRQGAAAAD